MGTTSRVKLPAHFTVKETDAAARAADLDGNPYPQLICRNEGADLNDPAVRQAFVQAGQHVSFLPQVNDTVKALRQALLHIVGDMPMPSEDPWERCRCIAAAALGYPQPAPMMPPDRPWPPPSFGAEVEFTPEMVNIAMTHLNKELPPIGHRGAIGIALYRAMHAAAPVRLISDATPARVEERAKFHTMRMERDDALVTIECLQQSLQAITEQYDAALGQIVMLRQALAMKDARIGELKSVLASTPVAFEDPDAKPPPAPGFLRAIRAGNKQAVGMMSGPGDVPEAV